MPFIYFSGGVWKSRKIKHLKQFDLLYHSQLYGKPTPLQMLLLSVRRLFKIDGKSSAVESIFDKVTGEAVLVLALVLVPQSSSSRNFEKFPFNQCYRLAVYWL